MRPLPGFELKEVVLKKVSIVPDGVPPCQNIRAMTQYAWEMEMERREKSRVVSPNKLEPRTDSGYESVEEPEEERF